MLFYSPHAHNPDIRILYDGHLGSELQVFMPNLRAAGMFLTLQRHDATLVERLSNYSAIKIDFLWLYYKEIELAMLCITPEPLHGGRYRGVICAALYTKHRFIVRISFQPIYNYYIGEEVLDMRIDITHVFKNLNYEVHAMHINIWDYRDKSNTYAVAYSDLFHGTGLLGCYIRYLMGKYRILP
jgi:hypothetical protein